MKYLFFIFLFVAASMAADPAQPKVGRTPVINATNGYAGVLTVRTQINLGLSGIEATLQTDTNGTLEMTSQALGHPSITLSDTNGLPGLSINVGNSAYWSAQSFYFSLGAPATDLSTNASSAAFLFGVGDACFGSSTIANAYHLYGIGDFEGNSTTFNNSYEIYAMGAFQLYRASLENSHDIAAIGNTQFRDTTMTNSHNIAFFGNNGSASDFEDSTYLYALGTENFKNSFVTNNSAHIFAVGNTCFGDSVLDGVTDSGAFGPNNLNSVHLTRSAAIVGLGNSAMSQMTAIDSNDIYAIGDGNLLAATLTNTTFIHSIGDSVLLNAQLANSTRLYAFGNHTGEGLIADGLSDVMIFGSSTLPTQSHQISFNVDAGTGTNYQFQVGATNQVQISVSTTSTNTPFTLNINGTQKPVWLGAPDSGGTGLRALTVAN